MRGDRAHAPKDKSASPPPAEAPPIKTTRRKLVAVRPRRGGALSTGGVLPGEYVVPEWAFPTRLAVCPSVNFSRMPD
jgi:hypothetical protein